MENIESVLQGIGLDKREIAVYLALLALGPSAIRKIAEHADINRGTTHDTLRELQSLGLVSYYHKEKHQHFVAEDPKKLASILVQKKQEIEEAGDELTKIIPQLYSLAGTVENRPIVKYYKGYRGIRTILEDVLDFTDKLPKKEYAAFSSSTIRPHLYHKNAFPNFTAERVKRKIFVRAIAIGSGGDVHGEDERRWLVVKEGAPTYTIIYAGKVAMISIGGNGIPHGLIIQDKGIYTTQLLLFDSIWKSLEEKS